MSTQQITAGTALKRTRANITTLADVVVELWNRDDLTDEEREALGEAVTAVEAASHHMDDLERTIDTGAARRGRVPAAHGVVDCGECGDVLRQGGRGQYAHSVRIDDCVQTRAAEG